MAFTIVPVKNRKELKQFIRFPYDHYRKDPLWVPPLFVEEKKKFIVSKNPMLEHCDYQLFLLLKDNRPAGRISAFIDRLAIEHWKSKTGLFGSFECIEDHEAAGLLLQAASGWLEERGMRVIRGPWSFASQEWGLLVEGFDRPPMIMAPYNPRYYDDQMLYYGLRKTRDLLVYELDCRDGYRLPERFLKMSDSIEKRYGVTLRGINMKRLERDVKILVDIANESTRGNWGYIPVTDEEARDLSRSLKPIVDPEIVMIAEIKGKPVGYLIGLPDLNQILRGLNGRLFPFGFIKMLTGVRKIRHYRIWGMGVVPEYQRKAIDILFYKRLYEVLAAKKPFPALVEVNYVLENNMAMNNPINKMGFRKVKSYRVYEKTIL